MEIELKSRGLTVVPQAPIPVYYVGHLVGEYYADFLVEGCVIVELKAAEAIASEHHAQLLNYLKATDVAVGLLLNFGPRPEVICSHCSAVLSCTSSCTVVTPRSLRPA